MKSVKLPEPGSMSLGEAFTYSFGKVAGGLLILMMTPVAFDIYAGIKKKLLQPAKSAQSAQAPGAEPEL